MKNARLDEAQAGIKIAWRNSDNLKYADDPYGKKQRRIKSFLMKVKKESEKAGLKLNILKILRSWHLVPPWQIDGETMEVKDFIFLGSKITAAMKLKDSCLLEEKLW